MVAKKEWVILLKESAYLSLNEEKAYLTKTSNEMVAGT